MTMRKRWIICRHQGSDAIGSMFQVQHNTGKPRRAMISGKFRQKKKVRKHASILDVFAHFLRSYWQLADLLSIINAV